MCIYFVAYRVVPEYPVIIAANRDELFSRPSKSVEWWPPEAKILAGRDMEQGGTWFGINKKGFWAGLTNFRDPQAFCKERLSRGEIVAEFLRQKAGEVDYLKTLDKKSEQYNSFNLLLGSVKSFYYYSNREKKIRSLKPGVYGLCNHLLDTPWPKIERGKRRFIEALTLKSRPHMSQAFSELLLDSVMPNDELLPNTGVSLEWERILSSIFVDSPDYGTRAMTLLWMSEKGEVWLEEKSRQGQQRSWKKVEYNFLSTPVDIV